MIIGLLTGLGKLYGNREFDKLIKVRFQINLVTWSFAILSGFIILIFNNSFINLWVGDNQIGSPVSPVINLMILIMVTQYLLIQNDSMLLSVILHLKSKVILGLFSALVSIIISISLIKTYGILGLLFGIIFGRLILSITYPMIVMKKIKVKEYNSQFPFRIVTLLLILWILGYYIGIYINITSWILLMIYVLITILIVASIIYFIGFDNNNKADFNRYFKNIKFFKTN